ncbi:MAG TPA: glycosyltransferase [Xanthobacteraceae bacterium]
MLSVIIATQDSERALVPTLAALVPGATSGIVSEVLLADGGSEDETAAVADIAGCEFKLIEGRLGRRLRTAAAAARAPWLMFLEPGVVLDTPWTAEIGRFIQEPARAVQAGVFRRGGPSQASWREVVSLVAAALGALPRPEQGLVISKQFYESLGGHSEEAADPERALLRRIGRRRRVMLSTAAFGPD